MDGIRDMRSSEIKAFFYRPGQGFRGTGPAGLGITGRDSNTIYIYPRVDDLPLYNKRTETYIFHFIV